MSLVKRLRTESSHIRQAKNTQRTPPKMTSITWLWWCCYFGVSCRVWCSSCTEPIQNSAECHRETSVTVTPKTKKGIEEFYLDESRPNSSSQTKKKPQTTRTPSLLHFSLSHHTNITVLCEEENKEENNNKSPIKNKASTKKLFQQQATTTG